MRGYAIFPFSHAEFVYLPIHKSEMRFYEQRDPRQAICPIRLASLRAGSGNGINRNEALIALERRGAAMAGFSLVTLLLVLLAGIAAGFVGYAVGATSLVSYPALLALGIPPVVANASNTVGVIGTGFGGVLGARKELQGQRTRVIVYTLMGAVGGVIGAYLLLSLDPKIFEFAVPPLILFSTALIAFNPKGKAQTKQAIAEVEEQLSESPERHGDSNSADSTAQPTIARNSEEEPKTGLANEEETVRPMSKDPWWVWIGTAFVAVYSGYFGAGAGTVALAVLDAGKVGSFHRVNALKTFVGFGANITASIFFVIRGVVDWPAAIAMGIGCFIGGYIAPPITRGIPAHLMRWSAVIAGIALALNLASKTYF
ncbi:transporter [Bifidobacterium tsurumiense]|uniref:Probable membrane transporter protein n=2 Tax=Bifidobacterium tsurumiense TaxID=356829 RepID=A0A087EKK2_9BIFI|nr:transporter [Bifidobacterium tsurumiense]